MLSLKGITIKYGEKEIILKSDFTAKPGQLTCLIGESGSGKSSLLNAFTGQIYAIMNAYQIDDIDIVSMDVDKKNDFLRYNIAYLSQTVNFIDDMTCIENIKFYSEMGGNEIKDEEIESILNKVRLKIDDKVYPKNLSGGERQRLAIAQSLAKHSPIILCDEITASLDEENQEMVIQILKELAVKENKIIILTTHMQAVYNSCDVIYEIKDKKLVKIKDSNESVNQSIQTKQQGYKFLKNTTLLHYQLKKIDRQSNIFLLYCIISAIVVGICVFCIHFYHEYRVTQGRVMSRLSQSELIIVNQTTPILQYQTYSINDTNAPFSDSIIEEIENNSEGGIVYPYYYVLTGGLVGYDKIDREEKNLELVDSFGNKKAYSASSFDLRFMPYYEEQQYDEKYTVVWEDIEEGAYLNYNMISEYYLDINFLDGEEHHYVLKATAYFPVAVTKEEEPGIFIPSATEEEIEFTVYTNECIEVEIEIPIIGFIDDRRAEELNGANVYLPIEYMETLRIEALSNYTLEEGQLEWNPSTLILFFNGNEDIEEMSESIRNLNPYITTGNLYKNYEVFYEQQNYLKTYSSIALMVVSLVAMILSYVYSIFYYQKNKNDIGYFKRNGLMKKEFRKLILMDCLVLDMFIIGISILTSFAILYYTANKVIIAQLNLNLSFILSKLVYIIIIASIQTFISRIVYYQKTMKE